jgi:hypothetical protein
VPEFILKYTLEYQKFLAASMRMGWEAAAGCIPHDARCARDLVADAIKHFSVDSRSRRRRPACPSGVYQHTFAEVCVD